MSQIGSQGLPEASQPSLDLCQILHQVGQVRFPGSPEHLGLASDLSPADRLSAPVTVLDETGRLTIGGRRWALRTRATHPRLASDIAQRLESVLSEPVALDGVLAILRLMYPETAPRALYQAFIEVLLVGLFRVEFYDNFRVYYNDYSAPKITLLNSLSQAHSKGNSGWRFVTIDSGLLARTDQWLYPVSDDDLVIALFQHKNSHLHVYSPYYSLDTYSKGM